MSHQHIVEARYTQGLAGYRAGHTIRDLIEIADTFEQDGENDDEMPSLMVGFLDGLIEDIRSLRPVRGQKA